MGRWASAAARGIAGKPLWRGRGRAAGQRPRWERARPASRNGRAALLPAPPSRQTTTGRAPPALPRFNSKNAPALQPRPSTRPPSCLTSAYEGCSCTTLLYTSSARSSCGAVLSCSSGSASAMSSFTAGSLRGCGCSVAARHGRVGVGKGSRPGRGEGELQHRRRFAHEHGMGWPRSGPAAGSPPCLPSRPYTAAGATHLLRVKMLHMAACAASCSAGSRRHSARSGRHASSPAAPASRVDGRRRVKCSSQHSVAPSWR